jgi:hypothetical protein
MPWKVTLGGKLIEKGRYNLVSIWDELTDRDMEDFIPGLEPLGTLSLRWLQCIGNRFADAVEEFSGAGRAFTVDVVDEYGQDAFVSPTARNFVTPARWSELRAVLD